MNRYLAVIVAILMLLTGLGAVFHAPAGTGPSASGQDKTIPSPMKIVNAVMVPNTTGVQSMGAFKGDINVMITFNFSHQLALRNFLNNLSNPLSPQYHRYISAGEFDHLYGPSSSFYNGAVSYFNSLGSVRVETFSDHVSIDITGSASYFNTAFHTNLTKYGTESHWYYSTPSLPELPSWIAGGVSDVIGFSNYSSPSLELGGYPGHNSVTTAAPTKSFGYPVPVNYNSNTQLVWGSDFQVAYNEQNLLNSVFPTNISIATILWSGNDSSGMTAPFYPQDVYTYFNDTLPSGQPTPRVYGVPLDGAPSPGISAAYDTTSSAFENTLDIEMVGSAAPGSSIYNVYTPHNTYSALDQCFAYIMNANKTTNPGLASVSVISNSWYSGSHNDTTWNSYLVEAQARGVTVLAASGDSGDNSSSSKYLGSDASYPGTSAFNSYGMVSVGGSNVVLDTAQNQQTFLTITNQSAWYVEGPSQVDKTTIGTQGGIELNITEPVWQLNSVANNVLQGRGRGVPDIGAVANNTIMYITVYSNGQFTSYYDNPYFYIAWGTSIASPLEAGIIGEMNAYLQHEGRGLLGFIDPVFYKLGNLQYGTAQGTVINSNHTFLNPFYDVLYGHNSKYFAQYGYSLLTGLGSINAYNMTMDILNNFTSITVYTISINLIIDSQQSITGIYINGVELPWKQTDFSIFLTNGTYLYNVTLLKGSVNTYSNGTIIVNGSSATYTLKLTNQTVIPNSSFLSGYYIYFVLAVMLLVILMISLAMRRKK